MLTNLKNDYMAKKKLNNGSIVLAEMNDGVRGCIIYQNENGYGYAFHFPNYVAGVNYIESLFGDPVGEIKAMMWDHFKQGINYQTTEADVNFVKRFLDQKTELVELAVLCCIIT